MATSIPPPNPRALLPPLLACLPTAFATPRPPPALLPLLSPILRQRVQLLSSIPTTVPTVPNTATTSATSSSNSWLPLLSRSADSADSLPTLASSPAFEPHPVSGEVEFRDVDTIRYRRLDEETLQARLDVRDLGLAVVYLWCVGDVEGGPDGWRVAEVNVLSQPDEEGKGQGWATGITEAGGKAREWVLKAVGENGALGPRESLTEVKGEGGEDEDAYWAQYDTTPTRTPGPRKRSMAPSYPVSLHTALVKEKGPSEEEQYFARYADIQPALDHDGPSEGVSSAESSLRSYDIGKAVRASQVGNIGDEVPLSQPRPSSSSSMGENAVPRLEERVAAHGVVEMGVRQHISTSIQSLLRLAHVSGIEREEFERLVRTEIEALSMRG
ncbi:MAG: hypothetical protein M1835_006056 [Candelina submexicana]|nr:MAG: hypothetical protein M1835_006056 [Candelina submexicana]